MSEEDDDLKPAGKAQPEQPPDEMMLEEIRAALRPIMDDLREAIAANRPEDIETENVPRGLLDTVGYGTVRHMPSDDPQEETMAAEPDDDEELTGETFPVLDIPDDALRPIADYQGLYTWSENDRQWIATLADYRGVIAIGETHVACRDELVSVLREWISFRVWRQLDVPDVPGVDVRAYAFR